MIKNLSVSSIEKKINKAAVHNLVYKLKQELNFDVVSVSINFITCEEIIPINNKYLGHNYSTDIITFNYSGENYTLEGEIFISLDDASFNAKKYKVDINIELVRLVVHGFLHLLGYDDLTQTDKKKMKRIENKLVNKYQYSINKIC